MNHVPSLKLMPKPFDWIDIPTGQVILGGNEGANGGYITQATTFDVAAFSIAKYPLTNAQFAMFVKAGGYSQEKWWTELGWQVRGKNNWSQPRYWHTKKWTKPNHPVVGVSWYEALAFCYWLSELSGERISLPTEQQWQWTGQGETQNAYPYGNQFDKTRCNFKTQGTTVVTRYKGSITGGSPFDVMDMSGNVREWCLTKYSDGTHQIAGVGMHVLVVVRGGTFTDEDSEYLRVDYRDANQAFHRPKDLGIRISRS